MTFNMQDQILVSWLLQTPKLERDLLYRSRDIMTLAFWQMFECYDYESFEQISYYKRTHLQWRSIHTLRNSQTVVVLYYNNAIE